VFSLIKRDGFRYTPLWRSETEDACRARLPGVLPTLQNGEIVLLVRIDRTRDLQVLDAYANPRSADDAKPYAL
jgi:hypothetical protein